MKTVFVTFGNHFDLLWRRGWERAYEYEGGRYASYSELETIILDRALALAEAGRGAYQVEQALTLRMYLRRRPEALPRLRRLSQQGLFELFGAGEAIIDINMCGLETMARNLASGLRFCRDVLGLSPDLACHADGFGSSAQFPQVIRACGLRGVKDLAYSLPDKPYWRGLDGSVVYHQAQWPGAALFYDHCYHEPCPACRGAGCQACELTGADLPQNFYPNFEPLRGEQLAAGLAQYVVCSEEMLPPPELDGLMRRWQQAQPDVEYRWGTQRHLGPLYQAALAQVDAPPPDRISSRVENNPVHSGCLVSRIRAKQGARRCEAAFYGVEAAVAAAAFAGTADAGTIAAWHEQFLELPLFYFHDAVTGTHQDVAAGELLDRLARHEEQVTGFGRRVVKGTAPGRTLHVFNPRAEEPAPLRIPLPVADWRTAPPLVAETADGRRFPVTMPWHRFSPPVPLAEGRLINAVGSGTRVRPVTGEAFIEAAGLSPLSWTALMLREAPASTPVTGRELRNQRFRVALGEHGLEAITDQQTGAGLQAGPDFPIGGLRLDEDEGDPWGTRKLPMFQRPLAAFTRYLGAGRFAGYSEAWYSGLYEPNVRFGRELDPSVFSLEWFITVRLLDDAARIDFDYEVFWSAANRRVRAVFPLQARTDVGWYSIPGGWLERPRYDQTETHLWSGNGDWPALHFVANAGASGWAVANYGTPAARIADGQLLVSLLRAPGYCYCLGERYAQRYPMPTSGIRDAGWHHFTLSLLPHAGRADMPRVARVAAALNARPLTVASSTPGLPDGTWPSLVSETVELAACKPAFDASPNAVVLRLVNLADAAAEATLTQSAPATVSIQECDLLETPGGEVRQLPPGASLPLRFRPFQIRSLLVRRETGK